MMNPHMPMLHTFRTQYRKPNRLLSREDKIKLIKLALENPNLKQKEIGDVFGVERSSVAKILKRKNEYLSPDVIDTLTGTAKRSRLERGLVKEAFDIHWMELEQVVYTWYLTSIAEEQVITDDDILDKAQKVAIKFGLRTIMPDQQWLKSFKEKLKLFSQGGNLVSQMSVSPADGKDAVSCSMNSRSMGREGHSVPFQSISPGHTLLTEPSIKTSASLSLEPGGLPSPDHSSVGAFRRRQSCPLPAVTTFSHYPHTGRGRQQPMSSIASSSTCSDGQKESLTMEQMAENTFFYKAGKSGTVAPCQHDETDAGHITISASPSISSSRNFTINANDNKGTQHLTKFSRNRVSPANIISFPPEDQEISQETVSSEADITEVQSSHCQNLSQEKQGTDSRSTGNSPPGFYIDLNNMAEAVLDEIPNHDQHVNENLESPTSGIHRISSESTIKREVEETDDRKNDPYKVLERSQSDAYLLRNSLENEEEELVQACSQDLSTMRNVSECSRVYLDLSRAEPFERVEFTESSMGMFRSSSGRQLETIPQDEELKTGDLSYLYASRRSFSNDSSSSLEDMTGYSKMRTKEVSSGMKFVKSSKVQDMMKTTKTNLKSSIQIYSHTLKQKVRTLQMGSVPEQINALEELNVLMEQAWSMPVYGKDLAYSLCDILRTEKALDIIISNLSTTNRDLLKASARLLEQSLTTHNRKQIAECGLEAVVKMTRDRQGDVEMASCMTGILESLFKTSEETCSRVIKLGGLDVLIYWCRCNDRITLKHCAIALSNLALYGGPDNQEEMAKHRVPEWLFPLAFIDDDSTRYYACLAIAVLVSNKEIEAAVLKSGTLSLVRPFVELHDPQEFAQMDTSHQHGRSSGWLRRLVPVLTSKREEAQALAAFHLAMEAGIKAEQDRKEVLYEVGAVEPLKWLASTPNSTASRLAAQALRILGEQVPHKLSQQVPLWTTEDVAHWVSQVGFADFADSFRSCQVDGDLLLRLTEEELMESIEMGCAITRKRFLRELRDLKISADYTSCDPTKLSEWLVEVGPEFSQYTYQMIYSGVDKQTLRSLSHEHLSKDCAITNGIHRMKILSKIEELRSAASSPTAQRSDSNDGDVSSKKKPIDVFISYRRSNGSQLASLLKVHLQLRGFTVFIDIERLRAGKFDESLLESVRHASNFIIVLTPNALDRCVGDDEKKDWVHKEIVAAIEAGVNIIPLFDNFHWPPGEQLPQDMRNLPFFNGVRWIHDYQDACVDKLERFIRGEAAPSSRAATHSTSSLSGLDGLASPSGCSAQNILYTAADKKAFEGPSSCPVSNASES